MGQVTDVAQAMCNEPALVVGHINEVSDDALVVTMDDTDVVPFDSGGSPLVVDASLQGASVAELMAVRNEALRSS